MSRCQELRTANSDSITGPKSQCTDLLEEIRQRDVRKCNVVISGILEETTGSVTERSKYDESKCVEIFDKLGLKSKSIKSAMRLGKKREDNRRLLRVTLNSEDDKHELMRHSKLLRHKPEFQNVFVKPDLTPLQRKVDFELRKDLRSMKSAQPEKDFVVFKGKIMERKDVQNFRNKF